MDLVIKPARKEDLDLIVKLLSDNDLPTVDVGESSVELFVGLINGEIVSTIGLERFTNIGLLRSLAVRDGYKNRKIGDKLVSQLFDVCVENRIKDLYLLTTTAEEYFIKYGFRKVDRTDVPELIKQTKEFKDICPLSAVVMYRMLF